MLYFIRLVFEIVCPFDKIYLAHIWRRIFFLQLDVNYLGTANGAYDRNVMAYITILP